MPDEVQCNGGICGKIENYESRGEKSHLVTKRNKCEMS